MGFRSSRRIGILPGLKLNFSGSGVSLSAGVRGAHVSYVLDVAFDREAVKAFGPDDNLEALLARLGGRFDKNEDGGLNRIQPPSWLQHEDYKHLQSA